MTPGINWEIKESSVSEDSTQWLINCSRNELIILLFDINELWWKQEFLLIWDCMNLETRLFILDVRQTVMMSNGMDAT